MPQTPDYQKDRETANEIKDVAAKLNSLIHLAGNEGLTVSLNVEERQTMSCLRTSVSVNVVRAIR